ncbi:hypothetical protein [Mycolicibacterium sp.]|uniref:hypothetical protein n=1 Tax=Mycolicibacterium sp. TaxID=2320850 RepID=UPI001A30C477|nr:hypothetical protein [Mycolicibacterium sp.]MBJ7338837.1 hypothetical protein [Mycolicibacterium sp.]
MASAVVNALPESEWLLIQETERAALAELDEDQLLDLHNRIRRARTKYVTNYRRRGSARVAAVGGRGKAHAQNTQARDRAEVFETALARVSTALSAAARRSAADLKAERIAAARSETTPRSTQSATKAPKSTPKSKTAPNAKRGDRDLVSPRSLKKGAGTRAQGARRQARKDARSG